MAMGSASFAQDTQPPADDGTEVDELTVTSQRREENVKDVPLSVNVVGEQQLERQQIYNVFDLSRVAPALEVTNAAGQNPGGGGSIRGIGTQTFGIGAVGAVGIVVDGVSQGNVNISDLFDLERVEVLKGPQGTLFGLTTSAGVINITTKAPSFAAFSGRIRTELSDEGLAGSGYGQKTLAGSVNIPLSENLAARLSANINRRQGPGRNALDGSLDQHNTVSARGRVLWQVSEDFTVNLNADYSNLQRDGGPDFFTVFKTTNPAFAAQLANCRLNPSTPVTPVVASPENRDYCSTASIADGSQTYGGSVNLDYAMAPFTLTSITAARRSTNDPNSVLNIYRLRNAYFTTPVPVPPFVNNSGFAGAPSDIESRGGPRRGYTDLITQEFRIANETGSKVEYTAGVFYHNQTTQNYGGNTFTLRAFTGPGVPGVIVNGLPVPGGPSHTANHSAAGFGQATWRVSENFNLIGGARYTKETLRQYSVSGTGVVTESLGEISNTSWRAGAQYVFDDTLQAYATIAKGYKGPQFATVVGAPAGTPLKVVAPEVPLNYEIGAKKVLFDGRVIADFSAFYTEVENYQGQVCGVNPTTQVLGCSIDNFDGVISKGVEVNLFGRVNDNFTLNTGLIWNEATYPNHAPGGGPFLTDTGTAVDQAGIKIINDLSGEQLPNAPVWKATFSGEYRRDLTENFSGFISADAVYRSKLRLAGSLDPNLSYPSHWILGGRLGVTNIRHGYTASLFVRNATDEHVPVLRQAAFPSALPAVIPAGQPGAGTTRVGGNSYGQFLSTSAFRVVGVSLEKDF